MRRLLLAWLLAGCTAGGAGAPCARHSDCQAGLACSSTSTCEIAADAAVDDGDGGAVDGPTGDAGTEDGAVDAGVDATSDASVDGGP